MLCKPTCEWPLFIPYFCVNHYPFKYSFDYPFHLIGLCVKLIFCCLINLYSALKSSSVWPLIHIHTHTDRQPHTHQNIKKDTHTLTQTNAHENTHTYNIFTLTFISSMTKDTKYGRIANRSTRFKGALKLWKHKKSRKQGIRKVCVTYSKEPHC